MGARRAPVSGGHERSRLARRRLDQRARYERSCSTWLRPNRDTTIAIKNIAITPIKTWPRAQFVPHRKIIRLGPSTSAGRALWFCAR